MLSGNPIECIPDYILARSPEGPAPPFLRIPQDDFLQSGQTLRRLFASLRRRRPGRSPGTNSKSSFWERPEYVILFASFGLIFLAVAHYWSFQVGKTALVHALISEHNRKGKGEKVPLQTGDFST